MSAWRQQAVRRGCRCLLVCAFALVACARKVKESEDEPGAIPSSSSSASAPVAPPPRQLYLPDGGDLVQNQGELQPLPELLPGKPAAVSSGCPPEMVSIRGQFCIDRYEASLVDARERPLSPYYPPSHDELVHIYGVFRQVATKHQAPPLPQPPDFSLNESFEARARSEASVVPSGYLSGILARRVCENAGKRLCSPSEWVTACKGQNATKFPYGDQYRDGVCNVFRESHPAVVLYGDASKNHLDPRLNLAEGDAGPLLRKTGATPSCRSEWGQDAIYDMVGNLDEWVDDEHGAFQGGFYSRSTREGCDARITVHPPPYSDYSLGVRCCK
ncbi:MAG TPA: SUMF1/EgtB/PvdO family nonheme iron enzyme [Polyangiaceae bacterium]|nr:SUMF1/EgtB/PvdO family nonheme iron enzyme [Polyangiaceae bacterium]